MMYQSITISIHHCYSSSYPSSSPIIAIHYLSSSSIILIHHPIHHLHPSFLLIILSIISIHHSYSSLYPSPSSIIVIHHPIHHLNPSFLFITISIFFIHHCYSSSYPSSQSFMWLIILSIIIWTGSMVKSLTSLTSLSPSPPLSLAAPMTSPSSSTLSSAVI